MPAHPISPVPEPGSFPCALCEQPAHYELTLRRLGLLAPNEHTRCFCTACLWTLLDSTAIADAEDLEAPAAELAAETDAPYTVDADGTVRFKEVTAVSRHEEWQNT